jgi:RNA polymerase sigma factor (sigma-70 family)
MHRSELEFLVERAREGDRQAFGEVYLEIRGNTLRRLERYVRPPLDPEDILADAAFVLWRQITHLRDPARIMAYAWVIIRRVAARAAARRGPVVPMHKGYDWCFDDPAARNLEAEEWVSGLTRQLSPRRRRVFYLIYEEGVTYAELEAELHISSDAARMECVRLRRELRAAAVRLEVNGGDS